MDKSTHYEGGKEYTATLISPEAMLKQATMVDAEYAVEQLEKLVKDRKTGECYDPEARFAELMQEPWFKAQLKRMANK